MEHSGTTSELEPAEELSLVFLPSCDVPRSVVVGWNDWITRVHLFFNAHGGVSIKEEPINNLIWGQLTGKTTEIELVEHVIPVRDTWGQYSVTYFNPKLYCTSAQISKQLLKYSHNVYVRYCICHLLNFFLFLFYRMTDCVCVDGQKEGDKRETCWLHRACVCVP